jgi:hypothetical protein
MTHSSNLFANNIKARCCESSFDLFLDMRDNFRKGKKTNTYYDINDFLNRGLDSLTLLQINDRYVIERIFEIIKFLDNKPSIYSLILQFEKQKKYNVLPEITDLNFLMLTIDKK